MPLHEYEDPATSDAFGPELSRAMGSVLSDLPVQTELLVSGAVRRGRRTRRRRRTAAWGAAGTALTALTAFAVVVALPRDDPGDRLTASDVRIPSFAPAGAQAAPPGKEPLTGAATAALLRGLLPGSAGRPGDDSARWQNTDPQYDSVQTAASLALPRKGSVEVRLMGGFAYRPESAEGTPGPDKDAGGPGAPRGGDPGRPDKKDALRTDATGPLKQLHVTTRHELAQLYTCDPGAYDGDPAERTNCKLTKLDGGVLLTYTNTTRGAASRTADVLRADGTRVVVTATGTSLTEAQVRTIAASPRWQQWVDPAVNDEATDETP